MFLVFSSLLVMHLQEAGWIEASMPCRNYPDRPEHELPSAEFIFGTTAGMREIREKIERAFHDDLPVLIEGESGTGKEVIGRFLHKYSLRREGPFLKLNCAAASAKLAGRRDLRVRKGATVKIASDSKRFYWPGVGWNALSSTRSMSWTCPCSGDWRRHSFSRAVTGVSDGGEDLVVKPALCAPRVIDLEAGCRSTTLSDELLRSFAHHRLRLLPLRERKEDIPQLCEYLLGKFARDFGRPVPHLSSNALEVLPAMEMAREHSRVGKLDCKDRDFWC